MGLPVPKPLCEHCERAPAGPDLGLCGRCAARPHVRVLYVVPPEWPPGWVEHLRRLAGRARRRLPLFDPDPDRLS